MYRFTIRDMLWLTVVVALNVAWWLSYRREAASNYHYSPNSKRLRLALSRQTYHNELRCATASAH